MNRYITFYKNLAEQICYIIIIPAFFLGFILIYTPFSIRDYYNIGSYSLTFHIDGGIANLQAYPICPHKAYKVHLDTIYTLVRRRDLCHRRIPRPLHHAFLSRGDILLYRTCPVVKAHLSYCYVSIYNIHSGTCNPQLQGGNSGEAGQNGG